MVYIQNLDFPHIFCVEKAPGQNRTDASSLEGYCSTIELQAHRLAQYRLRGLFLQLRLPFPKRPLLPIFLGYERSSDDSPKSQPNPKRDFNCDGPGAGTGLAGLGGAAQCTD